MKRVHGFTLIEIVVVLLIVGILFFAAIPVFSNIIQVLELNATARGIISDLRFAQEKAITGKSEVTIEFRGKALLGDAATYVVSRMNVFKGREDEIKRVKLQRKFDFRRDRTIKFASSGFPPPGGSGTVVLEDMGGRVKRIIVSSAGRIRME